MPLQETPVFHKDTYVFTHTSLPHAHLSLSVSVGLASQGENIVKVESLVRVTLTSQVLPYLSPKDFVFHLVIFFSSKN